MKLLAVDTSSNACSVALQISGQILDKHIVEPRAHTRILLPMISELLAEGGVALNELTAIVLGNGPGSFIGMRIGASVVQGLCFASGIGVIPISSLAGVAAEALANHDCDRVIVAQDARMSEVYLGSFERGQSGLPELIDAETIVAVGKLPIGGEKLAAAGAAWEKYPELLQANHEMVSSQLPVIHPRAMHLLPLGAAAANAGGCIAAEEVSPAYLRQKVAEIPSNVGN